MHNNILKVSILNLFFVVLEIIGGIFTGSISILSDAIHDFGDALSLFIAYILDKISTKKPNKKYTFGYLRYSLIGTLLTGIFLTIGSTIVIINALGRIKNPTPIDYNGMLVFAVIGFVINIIGFRLTHDSDHLNEKMISLHLLEDTLSWVLVVIISIVMKFTDVSLIDPILSILIAIYILIEVAKNIYNAVVILLDKVPDEMNIDDIKKDVKEIKNVDDIHHIHLWTMDGENNYLTMHVIVKEESKKEIIDIKKKIKEKLKDYNIFHTTIEIEFVDEDCHDLECKTKKATHHH